MTSLRLAVVLFVATQWAVPAFATGQCDSEPVEQYMTHPDDFPAYAAGRLGLVRPTFARMYLARAYLALSKKSLAPAVQQALVEFWQRRYFSSPTQGSDPRDEWEKARKKAFPAAPKLAPGALGDDWRPNCMGNAFTTAVTTLSRLSRPDGLSSAERLDWLKAQDQVFSNCASGSSASIPAPLAKPASAMAVAERRYQIAAASFYAGNYTDAAKQFAALSSDPISSWSTWAEYLSARALVRDALAGTSSTEDATSPPPDDPKLARAEKLLEGVVSKGGAQAVAARRLLCFIHVRTKPLAHLRASAAQLAAGGELYVDALSDWVVGLDQMLDEVNAADVPIAVSAADLEALRAKDELTDWVLSFGTTEKQRVEASADRDRAHAITRWRALHSDAWLLAALAHAAPQGRDTPELLAAAKAIPRESPAYDTALYFATQLAAARGPSSPVRTTLDDEIARRADAPRSSLRNALLDLRATLTPALDEVLAASLRTRVGDDDGCGLSSEVVKSPARLDWQVSPGIAFAIERNLPLSRVEALSGDARMPELLRDQLLKMAWSRALVLGGSDPAAAAVADRLLAQVRTRATLSPKQLETLQALAEPAAADERRLRGALALFALRGAVDPGSLTGATSCPGEEARPPSGDGPAPVSISPALFAAADRAARKRELTTLASQGSAFDVAVSWVLAFTARYPRDPRMPQLLYDINRATHEFHGCKASQSSKAAYLLMHMLYGKHPLTKQVKYWW